MRLALVLLVSLVATPAFAEAVTYVGKLGERFIQVELTQPEDGAVVGRFAYSDDGADVPLLPVAVDGNVWTLAEEAPCGESNCEVIADGEVAAPPVAATWTLSIHMDQLMATGTRVPKNDPAAATTIELHELATRPIDGDVTTTALHEHSTTLSYDTSRPIDADTAPYELHLLDVDLGGSDVIESNGIAWYYATDPRSQLAFPRLLDTGAAPKPLRVALDTHFFRASLAALDCKAFRYGSYGVSEYFLGMGGHTAGYEDEQITLDYVSPLMASWRQEGSLYCQGAHPYNHLDNYTLDGRTGEPLDWRKVFSAIVPRPWFSAPEDVVDLETALAEPDSYYWGPSPDFIAFIQQRRDPTLYAGDPELDEICASDQAIAEQLRFRVVDEAEIMFTLSGFPHVSSVCNVDIFSATLDELAPFLAETAKDYFPVLGAKPVQ